ncbi:MAG: type II toxin-antitoxin system RelE/ParE family toxin [Rhizobiales bacterium]|nr:type II toxin-antitoxin system RelE/ParE family toxin [Hyphomicrobiales bacterium]
MRRRDVDFSPEAVNDLLNLYDWIVSRAGSAIAISYLDRIETFCLGLDFASERGQFRGDIRPGLRIIGFERRITIAFSVDAERVTILRLFYGGQDWEELVRNDPPR